MKKHLGEIIIFALGTTSSVLQLILLQDISSSIIIFSISTTLAIAVISIRIFFFNSVDYKKMTENKINEINIQEWRQLATEKSNKLLVQIEDMISGKLFISQQELLSIEIKIIKECKNKLFTIHKASTFEELKELIDNDSDSELKYILKTYNEVDKRIEKARIIVTNRKMINNFEFVNMLKKINNHSSFNQRILLMESLNIYKIPKPDDSLICDDNVLIIHHNDDSFYAFHYRGKKHTQKHILYFIKLWGISDPLDNWLNDN